MPAAVEALFDWKFLALVAAVCVGVFFLVFSLKLRPREIRVFITVFVIGILAIAGMYVLTFIEPSLTAGYAYVVLATAAGVLLFIYYRYFSC